VEGSWGETGEGHDATAPVLHTAPMAPRGSAASTLSESVREERVYTLSIFIVAHYITPPTYLDQEGDGTPVGDEGTDQSAEVRSLSEDEAHRGLSSPLLRIDINGPLPHLDSVYGSPRSFNEHDSE